MGEMINSMGVDIYGGALGKVLQAQRVTQFVSSYTPDVEKWEIGATGASVLAEVLKNTNTLEALDLERNEIGDIGVIAIADALKLNSSLKNLMLESNQFGPDGA